MEEISVPQKYKNHLAAVRFSQVGFEKIGWVEMTRNGPKH